MNLHDSRTSAATTSQQPRDTTQKLALHQRRLRAFKSVYLSISPRLSATRIFSLLDSRQHPFLPFINLLTLLSRQQSTPPTALLLLSSTCNSAPHHLLSPHPLRSASAAPLIPRSCAAHSATALSAAIEARSFEQLTSAVQGSSASDIMLDIAGAVNERSVDQVIEDFKAAVKDHVPSKQAQQQPQQQQARKCGVHARAAQYCGGYPFYGIAGYGCGVSTLLYGLNGYQPGLPTGLGFLVDGLGAGLGLGGIL